MQKTMSAMPSVPTRWTLAARWSSQARQLPTDFAEEANKELFAPDITRPANTPGTHPFP